MPSDRRLQMRKFRQNSCKLLKMAKCAQPVCALPRCQEVREFVDYGGKLLLLQGKFQAFRRKNLDCSGHGLRHFKGLGACRRGDKHLEDAVKITLRIRDAS
jgi:hypothetical protein